MPRCAQIVQSILLNGDSRLVHAVLFAGEPREYRKSISLFAGPNASGVFS